MVYFSIFVLSSVFLHLAVTIRKYVHLPIAGFLPAEMNIAVAGLKPANLHGNGN